MARSRLDGAVFESYPIDGKDKGKIPDDGWTVSVDNTSTQPQKVTAY